MPDNNSAAEGAKLFPEWDIDEDRQVLWVGLAALLFAMVVGGAIAGWRLIPWGFDDDSAEAADEVATLVERSSSGGSDDADSSDDASGADDAAASADQVAALPAPTTAVPETTAPAPSTSAVPATTAAPTTTEPPGPTDAEIEAEVQGLIDARSFTATGTVEGGVATLAGIIPTEADRDPLLADAASTPGVVRVVDELTTLQGDMDGEMAAFDGVAASYDAYEVTLGGIVADQATHDAAVAAAQAVSGHSAIVNELEIQTVIDEAKINELLSLDPIQFASGSAQILPDSLPVLDEAVAVLGATAGPVTVEGHTDSRGNDAANKSLSQARADAVVAYLVSQGIDAERLTAVGFGEEQLKVDPDDTAEAQQENRRIEFRLG